MKEFTKTYIKENNNIFICVKTKNNIYKYLIVDDKYRKNELSLKKGGNDVIIVNYTGPSYAYCRIKYPWSFFKHCQKENPTKVKSFWDLGKSKT